jgi:hypothetical protein
MATSLMSIEAAGRLSWPWLWYNTAADPAVGLLTVVLSMVSMERPSCRGTATGGAADGGTVIGGAWLRYCRSR